MAGGPPGGRWIIENAMIEIPNSTSTLISSRRIKYALTILHLSLACQSGSHPLKPSRTRTDRRQDLQQAVSLIRGIEKVGRHPDRKSTRLNSSHGYISY